ncbi:MAG: tetraacyldisaccharide 4'-kinase [Acetobacteraceae bacterium]
MLHAPGFWWRDGPLAWLLSPFSVITRVVTERRVARPGLHASVPVICCGNVTVGGAGKTTLAIELAQRLVAHGRSVHVLLRGYGGSASGVHRVVPDDSAAEVGDEAILLAAVAPTWTGADRGESAQAALAEGADVLLMDDGLQNPTLWKDLSLLVIDGATGFGNGRLLPAGPLREPVAAAAARCQAAVLIGDDATGALQGLPACMPVLRARLVQDSAILPLRGRRVLAFTGIARPGKFFTPLADAGVLVVEEVSFPDHHPFSRPEIERLLDRAADLDAVPVTTPKDAVRLPPDLRADVTVVGVGLVWEDEGALDALLHQYGIG